MSTSLLSVASLSTVPLFHAPGIRTWPASFFLQNKQDMHTQQRGSCELAAVHCLSLMLLCVTTRCMVALFHTPGMRTWPVLNKLTRKQRLCTLSGLAACCTSLMYIISVTVCASMHARVRYAEHGTARSCHPKLGAYMTCAVAYYAHAMRVQIHVHTKTGACVLQMCTAQGLAGSRW